MNKRDRILKVLLSNFHRLMCCLDCDHDNLLDNLDLDMNENPGCFCVRIWCQESLSKNKEKLWHRINQIYKSPGGLNFPILNTK